MSGLSFKLSLKLLVKTTYRLDYQSFTYQANQLRVFFLFIPSKVKKVTVEIIIIGVN